MLAALVVAIQAIAPAGAHETPTTTPAARFLRGVIEKAHELAQPPVAPAAGAELDALIHLSMDWPGLAQFAIGRYRSDLEADGMTAVVARLEQQMDTLARRAGAELPGLALAVHDMRIGPDGDRHVFTTAFLPRFGAVEVEWRLMPAAAPNGYRIADVKALGLTLRAFLRGWLGGLIAAHGGDPAAAFGSRDREAEGRSTGDPSPP
jgi:hypothetical protein